MPPPSNHPRVVLFNLVFLVAFAVIWNLNAHYCLLPPTTSFGNHQGADVDTPKSKDVIDGTKRRRFAIAQYVDRKKDFFGVFSVHSQMKKFNMTASGVEHVLVVRDDMKTRWPENYKVLVDIVGHGNVHNVNRTYMQSRFRGGGLWKPPFNKLWLFNLTAYDKVIILDSDILIRTNIEHWFGYETPCATQQGDQLEYNSGAMVITPDSKVFEKMVEMLPRIRPYDPNKTKESNDTLSSSFTDQSFLSSIFTSKDAPPHLQMKTMPAQSAILSTKMIEPQNEYFNVFRSHIYETVHFSKHKPWTGRKKAEHFLLCDMYREWKESIQGIEQLGITPPTGYLSYCPTGSSRPLTEGINIWQNL